MAAPAADLEIHVTTERRNGAMRLLYVLHSPEGKVNFTHHKIAGCCRIWRNGIRASRA